MVCGVAIPHEVAPVGHSDADVGLHALTDAVLGAIVAANERCAEFNRQPNAGCQSFGTEESLILAGCIAALGLALAAFSLARERR